MPDADNGGSPPPSGAAAKAAAVLALLGVVVWGYMTYGAVVSLVQRSDHDRIVMHDDQHFDIYPAGTWVGWTWFTEVSLATALLLSGAILLLMRRQLGRLLIVLGCCVVIVTLLAELFTRSEDYGEEELFGALVFLLVPLVTAVLAVTRSTKLWCQSRKDSNIRQRVPSA